MKYKIRPLDLYFYSSVTQYIKYTNDMNTIDSPLVNGNGDAIVLKVVNDAIRGYARRNYQRNNLERSRAKVILISDKFSRVLVGRAKPDSDTVDIFITKALDNYMKDVIEKLVEHLRFNEINVNVSENEGLRRKYQKRFNNGDRVQTRSGREGEDSYAESDEW